MRGACAIVPAFLLGLAACVCVAGMSLAAAADAAAKPLIIRAQVKPDKPWKEYETRVLAHLDGFSPGSPAMPLSTYGGRTDRRVKATGFFRVEKPRDRWWLVDPEGYPFIHVAVVSVRAKPSPGCREAFQEKFGGKMETWAAAAADMLRRYGFNGTGAWTDDEVMRKTARPLVYAPIHNFMSGFGKSKGLTYQKPGHTGYPDDCIPVFHPEFAAYCDRAAQALAAVKDDPWLLGHFSDNEMPCPKDMLDRFLAIDVTKPDLVHGRRAAEAWLAARKGGAASAKDITDADREAWRGLVFDRYYEITTQAIRKYDPNHLCLGSRLHGPEKSSRAVFQAAGKHLDVIAVNYYGVWTPEAGTLSNWTAWSGRPVVITEWYTKGADSGMQNTTGAGWTVPTQADRGWFYQNYVLALLESKTCVGWHWFKYQDNDPEDLSTDPSNRDSNKGIVNVRFEPYAPLLERMKALNENVYGLADYFDR